MRRSWTPPVNAHFPEVQHKRWPRGPIGFGVWVRRIPPSGFYIIPEIEGNTLYIYCIFYTVEAVDLYQIHCIYIYCIFYPVEAVDLYQIHCIYILYILSSRGSRFLSNILFIYILYILYSRGSRFISNLHRLNLRGSVSCGSCIWII